MIAAVSTGEIGESPGTLVIDAASRFVMPGLIDAHVHCHPWCFPLFLQSGVTSVRDMGSDSSWILAARRQADEGEALQPRIFCHGELIDGPQSRWRDQSHCLTVSDAHEITKAVADLADKGVDGIKLYSRIPLSVFSRGVREAHKRNLPVSAHVGRSRTVTVRQAIAAGVDSIEHAGTCLPDLFPEGELRKVTDQMRTDKTQLRGWMAWAAVDVQSESAKNLAQHLTERRIYHVPTLVNAEKAVKGDIPPETSSDPNLKYVPDPVKQRWMGSMPSQLEHWTSDEYHAARRGFEKIKELTGMVYRAGARLGVGSDTMNPWAVPGFSLIREMELLTECGIPPMKVIQLATRDAAKSLGIRFADVGAVARGFRADIVILRGNPIEAVSNCSRIDYLIRQGTLLRREDIER